MQSLAATAPKTSKITIGHRDTRTLMTLLITFGVGRSYLFNVDRKGTRKPRECWSEVFTGYGGWSFGLEIYKPVGESVTFIFGPQSHLSGAVRIAELRHACSRDLLADLDGDDVDVTFFTTGVAVLAVRLRPKSHKRTLLVMDRIQNRAQRAHVRKAVEKIIDLCTQHYFNVLGWAERVERPMAKRGWSLKRFKEVDREDWRPGALHSYPLFFLGEEIYETRTESILKQVSSELERRQQSDRARVSYERAEVYVDWSEALIKKIGSSRPDIENNFIIALASWFALWLMNKNSSIFLLMRSWT